MNGRRCTLFERNDIKWNNIHLNKKNQIKNQTTNECGYCFSIVVSIFQWFCFVCFFLSSLHIYEFCVVVCDYISTSWLNGGWGSVFIIEVWVFFCSCFYRDEMIWGVEKANDFTHFRLDFRICKSTNEIIVWPRLLYRYLCICFLEPYHMSRNVRTYTQSTNLNLWIVNTKLLYGVLLLQHSSRCNDYKSPEHKYNMLRYRAASSASII